jgi:hypothetical protein
LKVTDVHGYAPNDPNIFYIARKVRKWHGSPLGNPFRMGRDGDRREVIEKYRRWLWEEIKRRSYVHRELMMLVKRYKQGEAILLGCWCFPSPCHGEILKRAIEYLAKGDEADASPSPRAV